jgi:hypothetical protein
MDKIIVIIVFGVIAGVAYFQAKRNRSENLIRMANIWLIFSIISVLVLVIAIIGLII